MDMSYILIHTEMNTFICRLRLPVLDERFRNNFITYIF